MSLLIIWLHANLSFVSKPNIRRSKHAISLCLLGLLKSFLMRSCALGFFRLSAGLWIREVFPCFCSHWGQEEGLGGFPFEERTMNEEVSHVFVHMRKGRWTRRCSHVFVHIEERTMNEEVFPCFCSHWEKDDGRRGFPMFCSPWGKDDGRGGVPMLFFTLRKGRWTRSGSHVFVHIEVRTMDEEVFPCFVHIEKRTIHEEVFPCFCSHWGKDDGRRGVLMFVHIEERTIDEEVFPCFCSHWGKYNGRRGVLMFVHIEEGTMNEEVFPCFCSHWGKDDGQGGVPMFLFTLRKGQLTRRCSHIFVHIEKRTMDEEVFPMFFFFLLKMFIELLQYYLMTQSQWVH
jgi:hypothetical protein